MCTRPFAVAFIAILFLSPAHADESPADLLPEVAPLRDRWERCAATKVRPLLRTNLSSEAAVDRALAACKTQENAVRDFLARRLGPKQAFTVVELVRRTYRTSLMGVVDKLRDR